MRIFHELTSLIIILSTPFVGLAAQDERIAGPVEITLGEALGRAIATDPRLQVNVAQAEAADGQIDQANLRPNPVVGAEMENFLGSGPFSGLDSLEVTLGISQVIETANKRASRVALARAERSLVDWDGEVLLARLESSIRSAFVEVLLAQEWIQLRKEQLSLAEQSLQETTRLVEAARSPKVEESRARLAVRQIEFTLQQARRRLATAKSVLSGFWGESGGSDFFAVGKIRLEETPPEFSGLVAKLGRTAALARFEAEERSRVAALDLEEARSKPDVEVFAGGRYFNEAEGNIGFLAGVEVPWILSDQNQGNIRTARAELRAVSYESAATRRELLIDLNQAYQKALNARADALTIQADLLPSAQDTLNDIQAGYERGQFSQLTLLEGRSALFEVREAYLEALWRYAVGQAEIEALTRPSNL